MFFSFFDVSSVQQSVAEASQQSAAQASQQSQTDVIVQAEKNLNAIQEWFSNAGNWFVRFLPNIITAILILVVGFWLSRVIVKIVHKAMVKANADPTVTSFLRSVISVALKILIVICALSTIGVDVTTIIATIGAAAVTIGLALKDSLSNVASGALIILHKRFRIGDYLELEGLKGKVVKIDLMYTTLCTYDNKEILIPNSRLTSNNVTNYFVQETRRIDLIVPIAYSEDIGQARNVIMELIRSDDRVIQEKRNRVAVSTLNESSVDLSVWIWVNSSDYWEMLEKMQEGIKNALDANGIQIPFNQLDVHIIDKNKNLDRIHTALPETDEL